MFERKKIEEQTKSNNNIIRETNEIDGFGYRTFKEYKNNHKK